MKLFSGTEARTRRENSIQPQFRTLAMVVAAIVTTLALNSSAHAKVIFHSVEIVIDDSTYNLDLNGDGVADFSITSYENFYNGCAGEAQTYETSLSGNGTLLGPLNLGTQIGPNQVFGGGGILETAYHVNGLCYLPYVVGLWFPVTSGYLGFSLQVGGQTYYGWAKLINLYTLGPLDVPFKLVGYAYQDTPGMAIAAGQKK